ncbi:hypothetical protein FRB94_002612 [Tulasnella sp. JGI-2019a]|nr:hypothetical protein FRB93_004452 [Tulasnella sp. JGI-2019a]KAG9004181.1 hypothetical protein FRB94_002612 [Tulasnella sp. JGI-2019a]
MDQQPTLTPGPEINSQPSVISLLTPEQLKHYPYLTELRLLVNAAFESNHSGPTSNYLFPSTAQRHETNAQLLAGLGSDFFTYIISSPIPDNGAPRIYASASGRVCIPQENQSDERPKELQFLQQTKAIDLEENEVWELRMLVVDPTLHKQGLASLLMKAVETEVVKRSMEKRPQLSKVASNGMTGNGNGDVLKNKEPPIRKLILKLGTCREVNEAYYLRRGFVTTGIVQMPKGVYGASRAWEACSMQRNIHYTEEQILPSLITRM